MEGAGPRMHSGFNHNIRYKGRILHVQTEDGGPNAAQVVTQVFLGGAILATARRSYRELLDRPGWREEVRELMKVQHLEEIRKIYSGALDERMKEFPGDD